MPCPQSDAPAVGVALTPAVGLALAPAVGEALAPAVGKALAPAVLNTFMHCPSMQLKRYSTWM